VVKSTNNVKNNPLRRCLFPLIFELYHDGKRRMVAGYKRPSEADASK
jgi:hypothetical protein